MKKQLDVAMDRTVRLAMIEALGRAGHQVTFVTGYRHERPDFGLGDRIRYLESSNLPVLNHWTFTSAVRRELPGLVSETDPDAVILDPWTVLPARQWLTSRDGSARPVVIADVRTLPVGRQGLRQEAEERSFRRGIAAMNGLDGITAITEMMLAALHGDYGLAETLPAAIWGSGVDTTRFDPSRFDEAARAEVRADLGVGDAFLVMYHGAISRDRGVGDLIDALPIADHVGGRRVELLLVGEGTGRVDLLAEAQRTGVADRIHYLSPVPNDRMPALISAADAGVLPFPDLPGWSVSSPIKLFEYLAMRLPVVVTDIEAHRSAVGGLDAAFFVESNAPARLAEGIARVAATPPARLDSAVGDARAFVAEESSWDAQSGRLASFLESLLDTRPAHDATTTEATGARHG